MSAAAHEARPATPIPAPRLPRLGFVGVGWIGLQRMQCVAESGLAEVAVIADADGARVDAAIAQVRAVAPDARAAAGLDELLAQDLDGIVIATPSAMHAAQAQAALSRGLAVFCQKPLARTAAETAAVIGAARAADRLLGVDYSYRELRGMRELAELVRSGALGRVHAVDLAFHNAYGPDKPWFLDLAAAGGGCVMDLGTHLADLLLWVLADACVESVRSRLYAAGERLAAPADRVEDFALAEIDLAGGATARLACSWRASAGRDCVIEASFWGTDGAARLVNVNGSFYDFRIEHCRGTRCDVLAGPPDDWGGRAICRWADRLGRSRRFDPAAERLLDVARLVDAVYGR